MVYPSDDDDVPAETNSGGKKTGLFARIKAWFKDWRKRRYIKWRDRHIFFKE